MNRIKSKQNYYPHSRKPNIMTDQQCGVKTRNQSRPLFKQHTSNPEKSTLKHNITKKEQPKTKKTHIIVEHKNQPQAAELYYQQDIIELTTQQATKKFKRTKQLPQNNFYKTYRQNLIESIYKECQHFMLKTETFFLYVYYIDTFMKSDAGRRLSLENSILVSYACFLMAQKYQEIYPPSIAQWLPANLHQSVYKWQGKIVFALNFQFIHESMHNFFLYWSKKYQLKREQFDNCEMVLESILFNYDLMYRYQPQKIAKTLVLMQLTDKKKKLKNLDSHNPFESIHERNLVMDDVRKHITNSISRLAWIEALKG